MVPAEDSVRLGSRCDIALQNLLSLDGELSQLRIAALRGGRKMLQSLRRVSLLGQDCTEPVMCQMVRRVQANSVLVVRSRQGELLLALEHASEVKMGTRVGWLARKSELKLVNRSLKISVLTQHVAEAHSGRDGVGIKLDSGPEVGDGFPESLSAVR